MRQELQFLLDQVADYQDRPFVWAERWAAAAEMAMVPCYRGQVMVSWHTWLKEIESIGSRKGLCGRIIKESVEQCMHGESRSGEHFGASVRYAAWYAYEWSDQEYREMCRELVAFNRDYDLVSDSTFYDTWLADLLQRAPARQLSL